MKKRQILGLGVLGGLIPIMGVFAYSYFFTAENTPENPRANYFMEANYEDNEASNSQASVVLPDLTSASEKTINTVVHITTKVPRQVSRDPFYEFFYGPQQPSEQYAYGAGSGVIINSEGYIVTNNHVIDKAKTIEVTLNNNKKYEAELIGTDPNTDLAVLKIKADHLQPVTIGNSDDVRIGEWVLAVGNPFDLTSTVTAGIVSAKSRNINIIGSRKKDALPIESFIQTDAAVNPGNSGGALVNVRGELIGINTAIASNTGSYAGYSFAIPVNLMRKVVGDIMEYGMVQRGFIGARIANVTQEIMNEEKLPDTKGVYIAEVIEGGAAQKTGIKKGEVILEVNGKAVNSSSELLEEVGKGSPGQKMAVLVRSAKGKERTVDLILQNSDGDTALIAKNNAEETLGKLGASFTELSTDEKEKLGISCGIKIEKLGAGKLKSLGLKEGMVISGLNNKKVCSVEEFQTILGEEKGGILLELTSGRGRKEYIGFGL